MTGHGMKILGLMMALVIFAGGALLQAAQVGTSDIEALAKKHSLSRSDTDELTRAFRGAANVGVNPKRLESLMGQALANGMEVRYLVRALILATNTALDGLPVNPMLNKFNEGLAKKIEDRDIIDAMENRALSLKNARRFLSFLIYEDKPLGELEFVLVSVASAMERGVEERRIQTIFKEHGPDLKAVLSEVEDLK